MPVFSYKMVICIRTDLDMSAGKIAVQVSHAAVDLVLKGLKNNREVINSWLEEGEKKVVLKVKSLTELIQLFELSKKVGINSTLITDRGLTEVEPGTVTCLGIGPDKEEIINKVTGSLSLL